MATQNVRPDPGALERQPGQPPRRTIRRKMGVYGVVAALVAVVAVMAVRAGVDTAEQVPLGKPSSSTTAPGATGPVGTVTFDGSTCSMEITADRIEPGVVRFEVVNATEKRAMFDSYQLSEGYTFPAFAAAMERERQSAENGRPGHFFPSEREVTFLSSEVIPAKSSGVLVSTTSADRHAIVCLQPYEGLGILPFGIVGPIVVR